MTFLLRFELQTSSLTISTAVDIGLMGQNNTISQLYYKEKGFQKLPCQGTD